MNYKEAQEMVSKYVNLNGRVPQETINRIADEIILREVQASQHKPAKQPEKKFCTGPYTPFEQLDIKQQATMPDWEEKDTSKPVKITVTIESDSEDFLDTPIIITRLNGRKEIIR